MRMSGGRRAWSRRSSAEVSPVRRPTLIDGDRVASPTGREGDPGERRPQVPLHVVGQGLERRDVQDPDAARAAPGSAAERARGPAGPGTTGTPRGSCRCRSGRGSGCGARPRSRPSPRPGPRWAPGRRPGTSRPPPGRRPRAGRSGAGWIVGRPREAEYRATGRSALDFEQVVDIVTSCHRLTGTPSSPGDHPRSTPVHDVPRQRSAVRAGPRESERPGGPGRSDRIEESGVSAAPVRPSRRRTSSPEKIHFLSAGLMFLATVASRPK